MTKFLAKEIKFEWMPACQACVEELKKRLTTAPVLAMLNVQKSFSIYCDASQKVWDVLLCKKVTL